MSLLNKLKTIVSNVSKSGEVKTTKSLKAIMEAVDFNVFRYREKTGKTYTGARGGLHDQRKLQDCTIVRLPQKYKLYALNIDQFLAKENGEYPEYVNGQLANIRQEHDFTIRSVPEEVKRDIGLKIVNGKLTARKSGYIGWLDQGSQIVTLRNKKFDKDLSTKGTASQKTIYRESRNGNLQDSFVKQLGLIVGSVVRDKDGKPLLEMDIDPANYNVKKENTDGNNSGVEIIENKKIENSVNMNNIDMENGKNEEKEKIIKDIKRGMKEVKMTFKKILNNPELLGVYQKTFGLSVGKELSKEQVSNIFDGILKKYDEKIKNLNTKSITELKSILNEFLEAKKQYT